MKIEEIYSKYSDPHKYRFVWQRTLWALEVLKEERCTERCSFSLISKFLTDECELETTPQAVRSALVNLDKGLVNQNKEGLKLMKKGRDIISEDSSKQNYHIEPGAPFSTKKIVANQILLNCKEYVYLCDPYFSLSTLDLFLNLKKDIEIRILTINLQEKNKGEISRALLDLKKEGYNVNVKIYSGNDLHDRYIIDSEKMWIVGHSLKDLGNKESFIFLIGRDIRQSSLSQFNSRWKNSKEV